MRGEARRAGAGCEERCREGSGKGEGGLCEICQLGVSNACRDEHGEPLAQLLCAPSQQHVFRGHAFDHDRALCPNTRRACTHTSRHGLRARRDGRKRATSEAVIYEGRGKTRVTAGLGGIRGRTFGAEDLHASLARLAFPLGTRAERLERLRTRGRPLLQHAALRVGAHCLHHGGRALDWEGGGSRESLDWKGGRSREALSWEGGGMG